MASPKDVPAGPLRDIAYRVPEDCMANMTATELFLRVSYVHDLHGRAASEPERKAERTRRLAERVIKGLSSDAYNAEHTRLTRELADANLKGDSKAAYGAYAAIQELTRSNPTVPTERLVAHASAAISKEMDRLSIPSAPRSRIFRAKKRK